MKKSELNDFLRQGDEQIKKIKEEQLTLIANYIKEQYKLERGDIVIYNGFRVVIVGFNYEHNVTHMKIHYRRIKHNGTLDNVTYRAGINYKFERDGKYTGKL